ncbi:MAG: hypothetical protein M1491_05435 [Deltaproteobacteria bacterium]|nr:hypothetical protein [Deltaproteobacteria bacterium]
MKAVIISSIVSWLTGFLLLSILDLRKYSKGIIAALVVDYAAGGGIVTLLMFATAVITGSFNDSLIYVFVLCLAIIYLTRTGGRTIIKEHKPPYDIAQYLSIIPALALVIFILALSYKVVPLGWDTRFIYLFRAKMLFVEDQLRTASLTAPQYSFSHPDYPLHIPLSIAYIYTLLGHVDPGTGKLVLMLYPLTIFLFMYGFLKSTMPAYAAVLSALTFLTLRRVMGLAYSGIDVPLALYILIGTSFYYLYIRDDDVHYAILSGLLIGIGAWTKDEGTAYFMGTAICILLFTRYHLKKTVLMSLRRTIWFLIPGMIFILPWQLFIHLHHFPANWIMNGLSGTSRTTALFRLFKITEYFGREIILNEPFLIIVAISLISLIYKKETGLLLSVYMVFFFQFFAYVIALYIQPNPLSAELGVTVQRLTLQITPSILLVSLALLLGPAGGSGRVPAPYAQTPPSPPADKGMEETA